MESPPELDPAVQWFVGFMDDGTRQHWLDRVSPRGFQHVFAFTFDPKSDRWIIYETSRSGVNFAALTRERFDDFILYSKDHAMLRVLRVPTRVRIRGWLQVGTWCVVAIKHLVGSSSRAWRPIALWRDLLKEGAVEVFIDVP